MEERPVEGVVVVSDAEANEMLLLSRIICKRDEDHSQGKYNIELHTVSNIVLEVRGEEDWCIVE